MNPKEENTDKQRAKDAQEQIPGNGGDAEKISQMPGGVEGNLEKDHPMGAVEPILAGRGGADFGREGIPVETPPAFEAFAVEDGDIGFPSGSGLPPELPVLPPDEVVLNFLIKRQYVQRFWIRTEDAQKRINEEVDNLNLANSLMNKLQQARNFILAGKEYIEEGDRLLSEVEHRLSFNQRVRKMARDTAPWLLVYELVWLGLLTAGFAFFLPMTPIFKASAGGEMTIQLDQLVYSMIWGGVGGVVGALFALWRHVSDRQDFDRQYTLWYVTSPVLGLPLGAFIFLVIQAGFFTLTAGTPGNQTISSALIIYVLAWVGGFKQNVIFDITRRILDVFRVQPERTSDVDEKYESDSDSTTLKPPTG